MTRADHLAVLAGDAGLLGACSLFSDTLLDDDFDDDDLDEDDEDRDEDDDEDEDQDDDEDEETETWQVIVRDTVPLKAASGLTSGNELPRLAEFSLGSANDWTDSAAAASRRFLSQAPVTG